MKARPKRLTFLATVLTGIGLSLPIQIMLLFGHFPWEVGAITAKLSPLNWAIFMLAPVTGFLVYRASPWLMLTVPALAALVIQNNLLVSQVGGTYSSTTALLGTGAFLLSLKVLVTPKILALLATPGRRWWLTPMRHPVRIPIGIETPKTATLSAKTFDLSDGGAFIHFSDHTALERMDPGTPVRMQFLSDDSPFGFRIAAEVVRKTQASGKYPAGIGIRFLDLGTAERRKLRRFLEAQQ